MARGKARSRYLPEGTTLHGARGTSWRVAPADTFKGIRLAVPAWVIGAGGFGITYRVEAQPGGEVMALKEYFPEDFADRLSDGGVTPRADENGSNSRLFAEGLRKFSNEAQYLQELEHPNVCRVVDAFMANGTAYYVSELIEGRTALGENNGETSVHRRVTLHDYLSEAEGAPDPLTLSRVRHLIDQLLDAVEYVHTQGPAVVMRVLGFETRTLLHRDIKPSNILVRPHPDKRDAPATDVLADPRTVVQLIDFGSARGMAIDEGEGRTKSVAFITDSYAPPELKDNRISEQGPQSDIYSLAATFWRILIGKQPAMTDLIGGARAVNIGDGRAPLAFLSGMDSALQMDPRSRPQSVAAWRELLFRAEPKKASYSALRSPRMGVVVTLAVVSLLVLVRGGHWIMGQMGGPTGHVWAEADRAYQAAVADMAMAEAARTSARTISAAGEEAAEAANAAAATARNNLAAKADAERPRLIYNSWFGRITENGYTYAGYCRPDPNGTFTGDGNRTTYHCSRYMQATTTVPGTTYSGPTSPWRIDVGSGSFEGHVENGLPAQSGVLISGDGFWSSEIQSTEGANLTGVGQGRLRLGDHYHGVTGKALVSTTNGALSASSVTGLVEDWPIGGASMEGEWTPERAIGVFWEDGLDVALGRLLTSGGFSGRLVVAEGRVFVGFQPDDASLAWGALTRDEVPYYMGQTRNGAPEGCGVRIGEDGKRRGVYVVQGLEDPQNFRARCRDVRLDTAATP